uniref:Uncharacterized protein MANES_01G265200 n=1 Tax=Rhizophora mucronata TaxID=61149 RepID=A0A2P2JR12_RHIMU
MAHYAGNSLPSSSLMYPRSDVIAKPICCQFPGNPVLQKLAKNFGSFKSSRLQPVVAALVDVKEAENVKKSEERPKFKWVEIDGTNISEALKRAISGLPYRMTKRCKAIMKQIICFSGQQQGSRRLSDLLGAWVRIMKPRRADWLSVLRELKRMEHTLYIEVAEFALLEESFEANFRDYTKLIHYYGNQNLLQEAENTLVAMKRGGFTCDQVTLTTMIHIYSKAGNLKLAKETFEELKLLGQPLDKRSYGSMIMAYIRGGKPSKGEALLREMDMQEIRAGTEVYKALLRAYSMVGDVEGTQRVFDMIQFAGIPPDVRVCALVINAYQMAGQSKKARIAFENMWSAGLEPSDKCVALVLAAYEKENKLDKALDFLMCLEREGVLIGKEASEILADWLRKLGVVKEVELVLGEYAPREVTSKIAVS